MRNDCERRTNLFFMAAFLLVAVLVLVCFPSTVLAATSATKDFSTINVKISIGTPTSKAFTVDGNYYLQQTNKAVTRGGYTVKLENSKLSLYDGSGNAVTTDQAKLTFVQCQATDGKNNYISLKNTAHSATLKYLGNISFIISGSGINCINTVYMEDYVAGVIPYEMSNSWPLHALKAQAITARTYAASLKGSGSYDVLDTAADQVYKGYNASYTRCLQAVEETSKQMIVSDNELAMAYFSASNGGFTDITQHSWSASLAREPSQVIRLDPYDLANPSSISESAAFYKDLTKDGALHANAEKYLKDLAIALFQQDHYVKQGYIVNLYADVQLQSIESITPVEHRDNHHLAVTTTCTKHGGVTYKNCADNLTVCPNYVGYDFVLKVRALKNYVDDQELEREDYFEETITLRVDAREFEKSGDYPVFSLSTNLRVLFFTEKSDRFVLTRARYGHGFGLSQRGAQQQANEGRNYRQIIDFYFPNTEIRVVNIAEPDLPVLQEGEIEKPVIAATGTSTGSNVNVRAGAGTSYASVGQLALGEVVEIVKLSAASGWHQIWYNSALCYVSASYIKIDEQVEKPEIVAAGIANGSVNIRTGPGTSYTKVGEFARGDTVEIVQLNAAPGWHQIWYNDALCYVSATYIDINGRPEKPEIVATGTSTGSNVNVRAGAGTSYASVGQLARGEAVEITALHYSGEWHQIWYNDKLCYVSGNYIKLDEQQSEDTVSLNRTTGWVIAGASGQLKAQATSAVTWSSSDTAVATVDQNGKVTGKKAGNTTITARTASGASAFCAVRCYSSGLMNASANTFSFSAGAKHQLTFKLKTAYDCKIEFLVAKQNSDGSITRYGYQKLTEQKHGSTITFEFNGKAGVNSAGLSKSAPLPKGEYYVLCRANNQVGNSNLLKYKITIQ